MRCTCEAPTYDPSDTDVCAKCHLFHRQPVDKSKVVIPIPLTVWEYLKEAEAERDKYRRVCGGKTPGELGVIFDRILEVQEETKQLQEKTRIALDELQSKLEKFEENFSGE
jgi:hypothetical protein